MPKKAEKVVEEVVEVVEAEAPKKETNAKAAFKALIETYKEKNPVKYELKKEALEATLKTL